MASNKSSSMGEVICFFLTWCFILVLQGAVPFFLLPTLGQAIWTMGFASSYANGSLFTIYAHDFGFPYPAPIAFGLAGAWVASLFLRLGLCAADAYAFMLVFWLTLAYIGAYRFSRHFCDSRYFCIFLSLIWMCMPIIWTHASYSMLSIGIALLPFYFLMAIKLFCVNHSVKQPTILMSLLYFVTVLISVFMDGYTFMMFFVGTSILLFYHIKLEVQDRDILLKKILFLHILTFLIAYLIYSAFIGHLHFIKSSIDAFRAMGVDLSFIVIPTQGVLGLADWLGVSVPRSTRDYFGDNSVWQTTFILPVLIVGFYSWHNVRRKQKIANAFLITALFSAYLSLGPSLKTNTTKIPSTSIAYGMSSDRAVLPTGNAWVYKALPGFNNMRAAYRWLALCVFSFWVLVVLAVSTVSCACRFLWVVVLMLMTVLNFPHLIQKIQENNVNRRMFLAVDRDLISLLKAYIHPRDVVIFLPWGNDFFANYLAPRAAFRTYNIGGDKNLIIAQQHWPDEMLAIKEGVIDQNSILSAVELLKKGRVDVIILPYFDMLWSAHYWPCMDKPLDSCFQQQKEKFRPILEQLYSIQGLNIQVTPLFISCKKHA